MTSKYQPVIDDRVSRSLDSLVRELREYAGGASWMGGNSGLGSNSYPGPEPGKAFSTSLSHRGRALDKEGERKAGEAERERKRRRLRRGKEKFRVATGSSKNWARHPDDLE
jgi:hypothetical protein